MHNAYGSQLQCCKSPINRLLVPPRQRAYIIAMPSSTDQRSQPSDGTDPLDPIVVASADETFVKVALFISLVIDAAKAVGVEATGQSVATRIYALVDAGVLEANGNVRRWRASEVRRSATFQIHSAGP